MRYFNRLRAHRDALGVSQWTVCKTVDITQDRYGRLEKGQCQPSYDDARRLARFFTVDPDELFPADVDRPTTTSAAVAVEARAS